MERILTVQQMVNCEKLSHNSGVSLSRLMDNAGQALGRFVLKACMSGGVHRCLILAGKGNNGGDGFVCADFLAQSGVDVSVMLPCGDSATDLAKAAFAKLDPNVTILRSSPDRDFFSGFDVIVDCLFGTGFHGSLTGDIAGVFAIVNSTDAIRIACDLPSGCDASNGLADKNSFKAHMTLTFHRKKAGLLLSPCRYFCGKVTVADIGIPQGCETDPFTVELCDEQYVRSILPERLAYGNKGTFGKVTAVCGSHSYIGAAGISALGALRSGVGLYELCSADKVINSLSSRILECTYTHLETDKDGFLTAANTQVLIEKSKRSQCMLIGCGLGHTQQTEQLVAELVMNSFCPLVIDADGINSLAANIDVLQKKKSDVILTPHPMELARLCGRDIEQVLSNRLDIARETAGKYGVTLLSKSCESFAVDSDRCILTDTGNTALSKGGSGDLLAGMAASLIAQGCKPVDACAGASYIMGKNAEMLCEGSSPRSVLPTDIAASLGRYFAQLEA